MSSAAPLEGVTVLDLTQQLPGPYATLLLASLGAAVIKVEPPGGDFARTLDPAMFAAVNAGKSSVVLDLKSEAGRDGLRALARRSDVVVEGFRPGVAERLGAGYAALAGERPGLVYCSISGFGAEGPYRSVPGHDVNYLGVGGGLSGTGGDGAHEIALPMVDLASGTMASLSVLAALRRRDETGDGAHLDVAMLDSAVYWASVKPPAPVDGGSEPAYGAFTCQDGRRVSLAVLEDKFWRGLCTALAWEDWASDPEYATHDRRRRRAAAIRARLAEAMATRPRHEWLEVLWAADVPVAPVHAPAEVADDPQVRARGLFAEVPDAPGTRRLTAPLPPGLGVRELTSPPALGADTQALLGP